MMFGAKSDVTDNPAEVVPKHVVRRYDPGYNKFDFIMAGSDA